MVNTVLQRLYDWSEVWALLIPLSVLYFHPKQPPYLKPVVIYLWIALALNLVGDIIGDFKAHLPGWMQSNNPLYNLHSIARFACFAAFFTALKQPYFGSVRKLLAAVSILFLLLNFGFNEDFFYAESLSGNLLSFEAYLLLVYCLLYYLSQLKSDVESLTSGADFWVATGLCVYVVINFFVFLFYIPMMGVDDGKLADKMWSVHNLAYILFCSFLAKAFYVSARPEFAV